VEASVRQKFYSNVSEISLMSELIPLNRLTASLIPARKLAQILLRSVVGSQHVHSLATTAGLRICTYFYAALQIAAIATANSD
jgi:hypothetical protein